MSAAFDLTDAAPVKAKPRVPIPDYAKAIIRAVAAEAELEPGEMLSATRVIRVAWPRFIAMHRLSLERKPDGSKRYALATIGRWFGRDHSTVVNAIARVESGKITMRPRSREAEEYARRMSGRATQIAPPSTAPHLAVDGPLVAVHVVEAT